MYPKAEPSNKQAQTYGTLWGKVALVYHTTETASWASFDGGRIAPHYEYNPRWREWRWHNADSSQRVGTMKSSRYTGVLANEKSIQVEIDCYSDQSKATGDRIWVGDLTDENYADLADFFAWHIEEDYVTLHVYSPPVSGWRYGSNSIYRLGVREWYNFTGLTAHGAVPGQTHWDTGVLDLQRIHDEAKDMLMPTYDDPDDYAKPAWERAMDVGVATKWSDPHVAVSKQDLMVFFDRLGLLDGNTV
jgi:hypothetical protein